MSTRRADGEKPDRGRDGEAEPAEGTRPKRVVHVPRIPGYKIESIIGRGATGVVYRARQLAVEREVALKVLHPELAGKTRTVRRLQREARTTARLAHPHIVAAIDMGEVGGQWWYAMELVDGPSLALRLRQEGRLPEREALRLFIPLCEALVHTWEHGVVHRDIKPANILLDRAGGARLADLGLAFADDDPLLTTGDGTLGTPHYISPEQARDPAAADVRSDIWSFGATLFHTVCGRQPFAGESTAEVLSGVLYASIPDPHRLEPELSRGLVLVLRKCLSRSPARRYQTPAELRDDLERVRERRRPKVRASALDPVGDRGPAWVGWAVAALVVALLAGGGWMLSQRAWSQPSEPEAWEALEEQAALARRGPQNLARALAGIQSLQHVPPVHVERYHEELAAVTAALRERLDEIKVETEQELDRRLAERDFDGARRALGAHLKNALRDRTGYSLERLPPEQFAFGGWLERQRDRVEGALDGARELLADQLDAHVQDVVVPAVEEALAGNRWILARGLLDQRADRLTASAGFDADGFPPEVLDEVVRGVEERLQSERDRVDAAWMVVAEDLLRWIATNADRLESELADRSRTEGAANELRAGFYGELVARQISLQEMPLEQGGVQEELDRRIAALRREEAKIRVEQASKGFDVFDAVNHWLDRSESGDAFRLRDYDAIEEVWERYAERAATLPDEEANAPWRAHFERFVDLRLDEVSRIRSIFDRAAERLIELDGQSVTLPVGSIGRTGTLRIDGDPRSRPFVLLLEDDPGELGISLASLPAAAVEQLAGLDAVDDDLRDPADRLARALLRGREGDAERALAVLDSGPLPTGPDDMLLVEELRWRLLQEGLEQQLLPDEREREADALFAEIWQDRREGKNAAALRKIGLLLREYTDVPRVAAEVEFLRDLEASLGDPNPPAPREALLQVYRPDDVVFSEGRRVELRYDFGLGSGRWQPGDWSPDGRGLAVDERVLDLASFAEQRALSLPIHPPIDAANHAFTVTFDLAAPEEPSRLVVVSVVGFHIALVGASGPSPSAPGIVYSRDGFDDLLRRIRAGDLERPLAALPQPGSTYRLRVGVHAAKGNVRVEIAGPDGEFRDLFRETSSRPRGAPPPGSSSIAVRSWESVSLAAIEVLATYEE